MLNLGNGILQTTKENQKERGSKLFFHSELVMVLQKQQKKRKTKTWQWHPRTSKNKMKKKGNKLLLC
jgi:hypothetical protein